MKKSIVALLVVALQLVAVECFAIPVTGGNIVVVQAGDGAAALAGTGTATFLKEYTPGGSLAQTINLPTTASGANHALTLSGTSTSEGFLALSASGDYLVLGGYNATVGSPTSSVNGNRVAGRVDLNGVVDTSTRLGDSTGVGNIRSVASNTGGEFWATTSSAGVRYTTLGSTGASTQINSAAPTNTRVANISGGQLYMSSASGSYQGVGTVGTGLSTTSGQTPTLLPGFPTATGPSSYDFWFKDASTLYVADDRTAAAVDGGIQKWTLSSGTWTLQYTLEVTTTSGVRGLAGYVDGLGNAVLFGTTTETSANKLVSVIDTGAGSLFTTIATAPTNTAFRGVEFIPVAVPEASSFLFAGLVACAAGLKCCGRRKTA